MTDTSVQAATLQTVHPDFIRRAVDQAELNSLRIALYQATGDEELLGYRQYVEVLRKGAMEKLSIVEEDRPALREKVVQFLTDHPNGFEETVPSDSELKFLFEKLLGSPVTEGFVRANRALVGFEDFPYFMKEWKDGKRPEIPKDFSVAIIGSGFSGICAAVQLSLLGIPFLVYERRHEVGGTWSVNRYPDVRVDTLSSSYQLGFVKDQRWTEHFARGHEVRDYIEQAAVSYGVHDRIRFEHDVTAITYDEVAKRWNLDITHDGDVEKVSVRFVVSGTGLFATPRMPDLPGVEDFTGDVVHTTEWPEGYSLEGKSVAVIGNGSTGVQLLPRVAQESERVSVFVRTPQWVSPREGYGEPIAEELRWLTDAMPYYRNWERFTWTTANVGALVAKMFFADPEWKAKGGLISEENDKLRVALTEYIKDQTGHRKDLYERLIPDYAPWSRRMIVDGGWYQALTEDHVELVTEKIDHLDHNAIVTADGVRHEVDVIISASGFSVSRYMHPIEVRGRGGLTLEDYWDSSGLGPRAYLSMAVPNFPNLFIMYGPNGQGGAAFPANMELWARYIGGILVELLESGSSSLEVKEEVFEAHNALLDSRTARMIFMDAGERNYYVSNGRVSVMAAWSGEEHWDHMTKPDLRDYHLS